MIDFAKGDGLVPVIIQHEQNQQVLMLGYMNKDAWERTLEIGKVTFYSRSKKRLWTKGESSSNYLKYVSHKIDCDKDSLLIQALPQGPTCHTGTDSCFGDFNSKGFLNELDAIIEEKKGDSSGKSYTKALFEKGINKMAQKVGEEAVETVIEATNGTNERLLEESADLLYHLLVVLRAKGLQLNDVESILKQRQR